MVPRRLGFTKSFCAADVVALALLLQLLLAVAANNLHFGFPGESTVEATTEVLTGKLLVKVRVHWENIVDFVVAAKNALASVAVISTPVLMQTWQYTRNFGINPAELHCRYYLLPHGAPLEKVWERVNNSRADGFAQLLSWQVRQNDELADLSTRTWEVDLQVPEIEVRRVNRPERLPYAPLSPTAAFAEALESSETEVTCFSADSGCLCAAVRGCAWAPAAEGAPGGAEFQCVDAVYSGIEPGVPCIHCAIQSNCPADPVRVCELQRDPCGCARSHGDCTWNDHFLNCRPRQAAYTSCLSCSQQAHCGSPTVLSISPARGSIVGGLANRRIDVTFSRPVVYTGVPGDIVVQCDAPAEEMREVPGSLLELEGPVLRIDVSGLRNADPSSCHLMINQGSVEDEGGLAFEGMMSAEGGGYSFTMSDNVAPTLADLVPRNRSVVQELPDALTLRFSESVRVGSAFLAQLVAASTADGRPLLLATFDGPTAEGVEVEGSTLTLRIPRGAVQNPGQRYTLRLPAGAVGDLAGNSYAGLVEWNYTFRLEGDVGTRIEFTITVENIDYEALTANVSLSQDFKLAVRQTVASLADGAVAPDEVQVEISRGSVLVRCRMLLPPGANVGAVEAAVGNATTLGEALVARLSAVPDQFDAAATGDLAVTGVTAPQVTNVTRTVGTMSRAAKMAPLLSTLSVLICKAFW